MKSETIAVLGGGNMGRALVGGLVRQGVAAQSIRVGEALEVARASLEKDFAIQSSAQNVDAIAEASLVIVAVKPQDVGHALAPLGPLLRRNGAILVSVAAGIRTEALSKWCGPGVPVIRAMPNRPALVGAGATALFAGADVRESERTRAAAALRAVGEVVWVDDESDLDVATALSGSGPAYFFLLAEAMTQAAVQLGLGESAARRLAIGTLHGAGLMARQGDGDLQRLRVEVTSKGGTTEAALRTFEEAGFSKLVARAMQAATQRSRELAAQFGDAS